MGVVQRAPLQLINLLGAKGSDNLPTDFAKTVVPMVDVTDFYLAQALLGVGVQTGAAGAFPRSVLQTFDPANALFISFSAQITVGAAGGTVMTLRIGLRYPTSTTATAWLASREIGLHAAGSLHTVECVLPRIRTLPSGSVLFASCDSDAVGADHVISARTELATFP